MISAKSNIYDLGHLNFIINSWNEYFISLTHTPWIEYFLKAVASLRLRFYWQTFDSLFIGEESTKVFKINRISTATAFIFHIPERWTNWLACDRNRWDQVDERPSHQCRYLTTIGTSMCQLSKRVYITCVWVMHIFND